MDLDALKNTLEQAGPASVANPAVTLARAASDTFAGVR